MASLRLWFEYYCLGDKSLAAPSVKAKGVGGSLGRGWHCSSPMRLLGGCRASSTWKEQYRALALASPHSVDKQKTPAFSACNLLPLKSFPTQPE